MWKAHLGDKHRMFMGPVYTTGAMAKEALCNSFYETLLLLLAENKAESYSVVMR